MEVPCETMRVMKPFRIPRSEQEMKLAKYMYIVWETRWPIVEILLIAELPILALCKAPFDASSLPPGSDHLALVADKRHELYAVPPAGRRSIIFNIKCMISNQDRFH